MAASEYAEWMNRGRAHQREGRPIDAMLCYHRAARVDPRASDPLFALGEAQWQLGRLPDAITAWREASRITRNHMAPVRAEAEALLAIGDTAGAVAAAKRVQSLMPKDARAALIRGIGALVDGDPTDPAPSTAIDAVIAREPALLAIPTLAGPLALALERAPAGPGRTALLDRIARSPDALANATVQLLVVALEHVAGIASFDGETRARLAALACVRNFVPADHDLLRRIACAVETFDAASGRVLAKVYASLCAETFAAPVPLLWPVRTAGSRWRIVVLVGGDAASHGSADSSLAAIRSLPEADFAVTLATIGMAPTAAISGATNVALPAGADAAAAQIIAARDPDVVVDLVGLAAMTGPLLARRPARAIVTAASIPVPNELPLVDRVAADSAALAEMLATDRRAHDFARDCVQDVVAMAQQWDAAVGLHREGDRKGAIARYGRVLAQQPGHAPALHLAGIARRDDGDLEGALAGFSDALAAAPGFADARVAAMRAASALGDHKRAVALGEAGRALAPGNAVVLRALGQAQLARRDGAAAAAAFSEALTIDPTDGETHFHHGVALQMTDETTEAARAYQRALAVRPDLVAAHFNLGVLFHKQGAHEGAAEAFAEVLKADSGNIAAWKYRGEALIAGARIDEFIAHFRQFAARHPTALPLAVQAIEACQYLADFNLLERVRRRAAQRPLRRRRRARARRLAGATPLLAALRRCRAGAHPQALPGLRHGGAARVWPADPAVRAAAPRAAAHRLPFSRPAQPRDGKDGVVGGGAPRSRAL